MDAERCRFLFGTDESPVDPHDEDEIVDWFDEHAPVGSGARGILRGVIARQILLDAPPEIWATAQRLTALGLDRETALLELTRPINLAFERALDPDYQPDAHGAERIRRMLDALPMPPDAESVNALAAAAAAGVGARRAAVIDATLDALDRSRDDELARPVLEGLVDAGIDDGELAELSGGRLVHMPSIVRDRAFTHRLDASTKGRSVLFSVTADLQPLLSIRELQTVDGRVIEPVVIGEQVAMWQGPDGWLESFGDFDVVAVRVDADGVVSLQSVGEIEPSAELVDLVRRVAGEELVDDEAPIPFDDIVAALILTDSSVFNEPTTPLSELLRRAGLDVRGGRVARDEEAWHADELEARHDRLHRMTVNDDAVHTAMDVLDTFDEDSPPPEELRAALRDLDDPDVFALVAEEIVDAGDDDAADGLAASLVAAARRPREMAIAHLIAARVAESLEDGESAAEHVRAAVRADPDFGPGLDPAAFYASVRGDAAAAARFWRMLEDPDEDGLRVVATYLSEPSSKLGRNDRCWCGSGRKFKTCHQGKVQEAALPDRVAWLCSKANGFLRRAGRGASAEIVGLLLERVVDAEDRESLAEAVEDPVVVDAALHEGGWFARFLDTMRGVLPDDEVLLAQSWLLVDRTVYEFEEVHPGRSVDVRDIATGERFSVRERTLTKNAQSGTFWCGRAVPDGETTQFVGAIFPVPPGREAAALEMCQRRDGYELCSWVRALYAPPTLTTRESEPFVQCTALLRAFDASAATAVLDALYERDGDSWSDLLEIGGGERIVRGHLTMADDLIEISTSSEPRMDRILAALLEQMPDATVESDEREPLRPKKPAAGGRIAPAPQAVELSDEHREELLQMLEQRWMSEPVPALGGVTPREAAADPTRRDSLRRLLATAPTSDDPNTLLLRPDRLRTELGL